MIQLPQSKSPSQEDLAELFGGLLHDWADELDIGVEDFFFHQLGESLFDAFAGDDSLSVFAR